MARPAWMDPYPPADLDDGRPTPAELAELERAPRPRLNPEDADMIRECFEEFYGPATPAHTRPPRAA